MKYTLALVVCVASATAFPSSFEDAQQCTRENYCKREDGCVCASPESPIKLDDTPRLITLTFDDSVTENIYEQYLEKLLFHRKNPDGKPISATFYIPHSYSNYVKVNDLYNRGFDIGVHSISKGTTDYWKAATSEQLIDEFEGQRNIISKFGNIPIEDITGVRTPHFEINGDVTFDAYNKSGLNYDSSLVTLSSNPLFPFTLDYKFNHQCVAGKCPTQSFPKFWVLPIVNLVGANNIECNVLFSCQVGGSSGEIRNWLIREYERRDFDRVPMNLLVTSGWFETQENSFEGLSLFLDYVGNKNNTFLVSHKEVINWSKNPVKFDEYETKHVEKAAPCQPRSCWLPFGEYETRIMWSCVQCPSVYPWLGNHYGEIKQNL